MDKELANIRKKFQGGGGLNSYSKKKYVWKLVYTFMLGYDVDFGHMEMISLISSQKYSEKNVGYIAVSLLLRSGDEMMAVVINSMRNDLMSHSNPAQSLALATIANLGGADLRRGLFGNVQKLLMQRGGDPNIRKKAALCLLRFFREEPEEVNHAEWASGMPALLEDKHYGVVTSCMALLLGFASVAPQEYEGLVPYVILLLTRLVIHKACMSQYLYYDTPNPWLQVKLLQFLQLYPQPADANQRTKLTDALNHIIEKTEVSESVNKSNADHAILFEAVNLIIHHGESSLPELRSQAMSLLGRFIAVKEPNIRYLGLETMSRLARLEGNAGIKKHQSTVVVSLKDADISMRRRALDLLFVMSDHENATEIVEELMTYLGISDAAIREEMVLKIAVLAERYTDDLTWYVDTMLQMIALAGDFVSVDVWHRIIQIVTNNKGLQAYAAAKLFSTLQSKRPHETAVAVGGYILGEFGYFIAEQEGMSGVDQFHTLHRHFLEAKPATRALLLSTYVKLGNLYPECRGLVEPVFTKYSVSANLEQQQRSVEYIKLLGCNMDIVEEVLKEMPVFPEDRETGPEARLRKKIEEQKKSALADSSKKGAGAAASSENGDGGAYQQASSPAPIVGDLLGVDDVAEKPQPAPAVASTVLPAQSPPLSTAVVAPQGIPPSVQPRLRPWFAALTCAPQGILYEDSGIRVGVVHEYRQSQGRIMIHMYNLSPDAPMENIEVTIPQVSYLRMQLGDLPPQIDAGGKAQQQIMCECMQPFTDACELHIKFTRAGAPNVLPLRLPIVSTCFIEPVALPGQEFLHRWGMLAGEQREQQEVVNVPSLDINRMASFRDLVASGMRMSVVNDLAPNPTIVYAAGTFRTGSVGPNGNKIVVGVMLMVEANIEGSAVRITTRAVHGLVALSVKNIARLLLLS